MIQAVAEVWDPEAGILVARLEGGGDGLHSLALYESPATPGRLMLAWGNEHSQFKLFDVTRRTPVGQSKFKLGTQVKVILSGRRVVATTESDVALILDGDTGKALHQLQLANKCVHALASVTAEGGRSYLAVTSRSAMEVFDTEAGVVVHSVSQPHGEGILHDAEAALVVDGVGLPGEEEWAGVQARCLLIIGFPGDEIDPDDYGYPGDREREPRPKLRAWDMGPAVSQPDPVRAANKH
jgi:hypothetical protein